MKPVIHRLLWLIVLLGITCYISTIHAQEQGRSDQPTTPGGQAGERPGQGGMGERGQMA